MPYIVPNQEGIDIKTKSGKLDAHIRLENLNAEPRITVDIFKTDVPDSDEAHLESESFPVSVRGALRASELLRDYGFEETIKVP